MMAVAEPSRAGADDASRHGTVRHRYHVTARAAARLSGGIP